MNQLELLKNALAKENISFEKDHPLAGHTTFRIGGPADLFCQPRTVGQLQQTLNLCREAGVRYYLLGNGSNTLFSDQGFRGAVISTRGLDEPAHFQGEGVVCQAGEPLSLLCRDALDRELTGLEFAYGIPGSVGGAIYMNAGAYGGEMKDVLVSVTFLDESGQIRTLPVQELELGYRTSIFQKKDWCILSALFRLKAGSGAAIQARMIELMDSRKAKQPLEYPSAGSTFKRPAGAFAGALIQDCGLRGYRVGGAAISEKHCGFVVNLGGATCADVVRLCQDVARIVEEKTGYRLEREIRIVE